MTTQPGTPAASIIPGFRYRDAAAAIGWLCEAFGFEKNAAYADDSGLIVHAQLTYGGGMIMLGAVRDDEFGRLMIHPDETGKRATVANYVVVDDPDAHYARPKSRGAEIVMDIKDVDYGGRVYSCLDCEGHLWTFGDYDPWRSPADG